jgi:hypothetical protein
MARNRRAEDQPKYPLLDVVRHRKCAPIATNNHNRAIITARTASRPHHGRKAAPRVDCGGGPPSSGGVARFSLGMELMLVISIS